MRKSKPDPPPKPPRISGIPTSPPPGPMRPPRPPRPAQPKRLTENSTKTKRTRSVGTQFEPSVAIPVGRRFEYSLEDGPHASLIRKILSDQNVIACRLQLPTEGLPLPNTMTGPELLRYGLLVRAMKLHLLKE